MLRSMKLKCLNPHITCVLCGGYLVDATTIIECLHSFCRSCIVRYLETSFLCPVCDVEIHKTRPLLHIKSDHVLQDIVHKLVPGLCHEQRGTDAADAKSKQNGCPDDIDVPVCIQLEYYGRNRYHRVEEQIFPTRYLRCSSKVTVGVLKKFLSIKFGIPPTHQPQLVRSDEILDNHISMTELCRIYGLYAKSFLDIKYIFLPNKEDDELKTEGQEAKRVKIDHLQQYRQNELQQLKIKRKRRRKTHPKEDAQQQHILPKQRKRRMKNMSGKERQEQGSNEEKINVYQPMAERHIEDTIEPEKRDEHRQPMLQQGKQHYVVQREQEQDRSTENQTTIELQYQNEQEEQPLRLQQSIPGARLSTEKQQADCCFQNRTEQINVHLTQNYQSKENEELKQGNVYDKPSFCQLKNHIVSTAKNCTETESRESLESFKISPPPLRSRNLDNTNCAKTFASPPLWNAIEPTAF